MNRDQKIKVFLVEDDLMLREMLNDRLKEDSELEVYQFSTGEACIEELGHKPDLVILDYHLNTIEKDAANGIKILETIKKNSPSTEVVLCSSQDRYGIAMHQLEKVPVTISSKTSELTIRSPM